MTGFTSLHFDVIRLDGGRNNGTGSFRNARVVRKKRVLKAKKKKKEIAIETGWHPNDGGRLPCYYTILYSVVRAFVSTEPNDGSFESAGQETQGSDVRVMVTPNRHTNKKTKDLNRHSYLQRIPSRSPFWLSDMVVKAIGSSSFTQRNSSLFISTSAAAVWPRTIHRDPL